MGITWIRGSQSFLQPVLSQSHSTCHVARKGLPSTLGHRRSRSFGNPFSGAGLGKLEIYLSTHCNPSVLSGGRGDLPRTSEPGSSESLNPSANLRARKHGSCWRTRNHSENSSRTSRWHGNRPGASYSFERERTAASGTVCTAMESGVSLPSALHASLQRYMLNVPSMLKPIQPSNRKCFVAETLKRKT